jgi:hypothetical protein
MPTRFGHNGTNLHEWFQNSCKIDNHSPIAPATNCQSHLRHIDSNPQPYELLGNGYGGGTFGFVD